MIGVHPGHNIRPAEEWAVYRDGVCVQCTVNVYHWSFIKNMQISSINVWKYSYITIYISGFQGVNFIDILKNRGQVYEDDRNQELNHTMIGYNFNQK